MATIPSTISGTIRGTSGTLEGCIIQNATLRSSPSVEQIADQTGAIALEVVYDTRWDLTLSLISATENRPGILPEGGDTFEYDGKTWFVDSLEEGQTYNAATQWTITAHRYVNTPPAGGDAS